MTSLAVLAPMSTELRPFLKLTRLTKRVAAPDLTVYEGAIGGWPVVATQIGVGPERARQATTRLLDHLDVAHVVVMGVAGGVDPALSIGDIVIPAVVRDERSGDEHTPSPLPGLAHEPRGRLQTTDVLHLKDETDDLVAAGVTALDMETSAAAEVCAARGVPWSVVRSISDRMQDGIIGEDVMTMLNADGSMNVKAALKVLVRQPRRMFELRQLAQDSSKATRAAARTVHEAISRGGSGSSSP